VYRISNFRECDLFWNFLKSFSGQVYFIVFILFLLASKLCVKGGVDNTYENLMYIGPCIIVIVEEYETNLMSEFIKLYFTSSMLNMFWTLIHPSSGTCDFPTISPHWSCVLVSMCVGVSVWLGWGGIRGAV